MKYFVLNKSDSAHCCFEFTVLEWTGEEGIQPESQESFDALYNVEVKDDYGRTVIQDTPYGLPYSSVCECFDESDAKLIAEALNEKVSK